MYLYLSIRSHRSPLRNVAYCEETAQKQEKLINLNMSAI